MLLFSTINLLKRLPLFADLPDSLLSQLADQCRMDLFQRDEAIFYQGDGCDRVWMVRLGQVKIIRQEESGREVILEMIAPGEVFGGTTLFMPKHPATARSIEETETISFSKESYISFLRDCPPLALRLIQMLGHRLHSMMSLQVLAGERVERRLAHILLKLANRSGRKEPEGILVTIPLSRQDLADMSGTTLETAIRIMSRFSREGIVKTRRGGYVLIIDSQRLLDL